MFSLRRIGGEMSDIEKEAARYRWLRDNRWLDTWWSVAGPRDRCDNIDFDIDAAMAEGTPQDETKT